MPTNRKTPQLSELRRQAAAKGCGIEFDRECQCYRYTAPRGQRFAEQLHELISVFGGGFIGNGAAITEARAHLADDVAGHDPEPCDDPTCDWCNGDQFQAPDEKAMRFHGLMGHTFFVVVGPLDGRHVRAECTTVESARRTAAECRPEEYARAYEKITTPRGPNRYGYRAIED